MSRDIRVLVVDDSALMRRSIKKILEGHRGFNVRTARHGAHALEVIASYDPNVVTLDINMPVMDGLTCLNHIMLDHPRPVIMLSSLTERGAAATLEALELGASDYVAKPDGTISLGIDAVGRELVGKVRAAHRHWRRRARSTRVEPTKADIKRRHDHAAATSQRAEPEALDGVVLVGVSTGGPQTLEQILSQLPQDFPWPIVIAQHMPNKFTSVFAERLNRNLDLAVYEVTRPMPLRAGCVYIGRGDADIVLSRRRNTLLARSVPPSEEFAWHPSVERMVRSALDLCEPTKLIGVMLTGIGDDGAKAMTELRQAGGLTIAESEGSAVVYGMPRSLVELGGATVSLARERIALRLLRWASEAA